MFEVSEKSIIMVDTQDWKDELLSDVYIPAFGGNLDTDTTSPIGVLLNADAAMGTRIQAALGELANCYNPFSAQGTLLTKIGNAYGYIRRTDSPAHASVVFSGSSGLIVPAGFVLQDNDGNEWTTDVDTTIGTYVPATCSVKGTKIPPNFINTLVSTLVGVDSVSQPSAGVNGYEEESDEEMSARMVATGYSGRGRGTLGAIAAAISNVSGVYGISYYENDTSDPITWRGKTLARNSIYLCVAGGDNTEICEAIAKTKTNGCSTNGSVDINFVDPENTNYIYTYKIDRPQFQNIYVQLVSKNGVDLTDSLPLFKDALNNSQQVNAFPLGSEISSVDIINRIPKDLTDLGVVACNISTDGLTWVKTISTNADILLQIPEENITIVEDGS